MIAASVAPGQNSSISADTTRFTPISGTLPGIVRSQDKPYLAVGTILVPPGSTVRIEPGTILLFNPFIGLHIQGTLIAEGKQKQEIVFTSVNDTAFNTHAKVSAVPFDWNGIDIDENALGTHFSHCRISYSVYGIRSQTTQFRIMKSVFRLNGNNDVSIQGQKQNVGMEYFSYNAIQEQKPVLLTAQQNQNAQPLPVTLPAPANQAKKSSRLGFRIAFLTLGCVGTGVGAFSTPGFVSSNKDLKEIRKSTDQNLIQFTAADLEKAQGRRNTYAAVMAGGYALGLIGTVFFTWSFIF